MFLNLLFIIFNLFTVFLSTFFVERRRIKENTHLGQTSRDANQFVGVFFYFFHGEMIFHPFVPRSYALSKFLKSLEQNQLRDLLCFCVDERVSRALLVHVCNLELYSSLPIKIERSAIIFAIQNWA